jgi:hypothetical protein
MLIRRIERFLRETGMPWTKFGRLAVSDPRFVEDLRNGRLPRATMERRVEHFMNTYQEDASTCELIHRAAGR